MMLTTTDVAKMTGYSRNTIARFAATGQLPGIQRKPGAAWRFRLEDVERFMRGEL